MFLLHTNDNAIGNVYEMHVTNVTVFTASRYGITFTEENLYCTFITLFIWQQSGRDYHQHNCTVVFADVDFKMNHTLLHKKFFSKVDFINHRSLVNSPSLRPSNADIAVCLMWVRLSC